MIIERSMADHAVRLACGGEPVLVVGSPTPRERATATRPFRTALQWGQLVDTDFDRLVSTARDVGVMPVIVAHARTPRQSVVLCGGPLRRLIRRMDEDANT